MEDWYVLELTSLMIVKFFRDYVNVPFENSPHKSSC